MSDIPDGPGTAAEGVAMARVLEPLHGGKTSEATLDHGHFAESACLNCRSPLTGPYCAECGQAAHLHRTFGAFLHDIAHGVLHFDGKTWRTLPMLALRPGQLTRRYIEGERANFVSPMALFLFSIFLMFAAFQIMGISPPAEIDPQYSIEGPGEAMVARLEKERAELVSALPENPTGTSRRAEIEERLAEVDDDLVQAREIPRKLFSGKGFTAAQPSAGNVRLDAAIAKWRENPGLMLYKLQSNSYKFSWLLIPLSLPLVWLIFAWHRRFGLYDHAVFITYSIAFMTLLFLTLAITRTAGVPARWLAILLLWVPPVHIFAHIKGAYELGIFSALWRTFALMLFIAVVALLFAIMLIALGAMG